MDFISTGILGFFSFAPRPLGMKGSCRERGAAQEALALSGRNVNNSRAAPAKLTGPAAIHPPNLFFGLVYHFSLFYPQSPRTSHLSREGRKMGLWNNGADCRGDLETVTQVSG